MDFVFRFSYFSVIPQAYPDYPVTGYYMEQMQKYKHTQNIILLPLSWANVSHLVKTSKTT